MNATNIYIYKDHYQLWINGHYPFLYLVLFFFVILCIVQLIYYKIKWPSFTNVIVVY